MFNSVCAINVECSCAEGLLHSLGQPMRWALSEQLKFFESRASMWVKAFCNQSMRALCRVRRAVAAIVTAGLIGACLLPSAAATAPEVKKPQVERPTRVLFVGNSYLYYGDSVHNHVRRLVDAGGITPLDSLQYKSSTIGGASLDHHPIDWLTTPGRIGVKQPFELVILQGGSSEPLSPKRAKQFRAVLAEHNKLIRSRGASVALYMTQAYSKDHKSYSPANISKTEAMYVEAGNEIDALVIPVGLAFEEAYRRYPDLKLHKSDGTHPSLIGSYLAACTVYAAVYAKSPVGNPYTYEGAVSQDLARQMQQVAQDTVQRFYQQ